MALPAARPPAPRRDALRRSTERLVSRLAPRAARQASGSTALPAARPPAPRRDALRRSTERLASRLAPRAARQASGGTALPAARPPAPCRDALRRSTERLASRLAHPRILASSDLRLASSRLRIFASHPRVFGSSPRAPHPHNSGVTRNTGRGMGGFSTSHSWRCHSVTNCRRALMRCKASSVHSCG